MADIIDTNGMVVTLGGKPCSMVSAMGADWVDVAELRDGQHVLSGGRSYEIKRHYGDVEVWGASKTLGELA